MVKNNLDGMFAATDVPDRRRLTSIVALTTFYQLHFATKDKKLLKAVWATHKKVANIKSHYLTLSSFPSFFSSYSLFLYFSIAIFITFSLYRFSISFSLFSFLYFFIFLSLLSLSIFLFFLSLSISSIGWNEVLLADSRLPSGRGSAMDALSLST